MAYSILEAMRRNLRIRHAAEANTPVVNTSTSSEVPIWLDGRLSSSVEGSAQVKRVVWLPTDTFTGSATAPTVSVSKRANPGFTPGPAAGPTTTDTVVPTGGQASQIPAGAHTYVFTYLVNGNETVASPGTAVTVTGGHYVALTNITVGPSGTTARRLYRSDAGTTTPLYYIGQINDNTTTVYNDYGLDVELAPSAPTTALVASAGNIEAGTHVWAYSFVNAQGEGPVSAASNPALTTDATHGQVTVTIAAGPAGTIARNIYRSTAGTATPLLYVGTVADNTSTTFTDNVSDMDLGSAGPTAAGTTPPVAGGTATVLATWTFSANRNAAAFSPVNIPITATNAATYLGPGDILTFTVTQNSTGTALTGGRVYVDIERL
jgi:hypothetical protein